MNRKAIFIITALMLCAGFAQAQNDEDEIEVITDEGALDVIDVPVGMMLEVDSLLNLYNARNYLQEENCNYRDVNPEFPRETYIERLQRIPSIMEMPYNEVVRKFIDRYAVKLRRSVGYMLGASNFYMPIFEQALETYNLPLELKYLPVIESALSPKATSRVGAAGLWQFMLATGKQYGLEVTSLVDERRDPIKSSDAAARYLRDLFRIYHDWSLVIAAYNCGPENINKAIHRAGGEKDYWAIYKYLPRETQGYVPAFIAANYIMTYYCDHNICPMRTTLPAKTDTLMIDRDVHFRQIAAVTGIDIEELRTLNPQYRRDIVNGNSKVSILRLPQNYINAFIDNEDSIYNYELDRWLTKRAEVEVTQNEEAVAPTNNRSSHSRKQAVSGKRGKHDRHARSGRGRNRGGQSVTVKQGQTLSELARKHHTTVSKLRKLNGIKGNNIRAGKKLKVK
ncbi:MAG: transglycosylase SLT domain-containing protein [Prevotella sp.]|nr:transglycosylase SLT domain-containing protein [Prevotella sp.]